MVQEKEEFNRWLAHQARSAEAPTTPLARRGQGLLLAHGCSACHTVRGTPAAGVIGPDLTHVGSRLSIAAGTLPSESDHFRRWIASPEAAKPGARMPKFDMLPPDELQTRADYLKGLK